MEFGPVFVIESVDGRYVVRQFLKGELRSVRLAVFDELEDAESYVESLVARELGAQVIKSVKEVYGSE